MYLLYCILFLQPSWIILNKKESPTQDCNLKPIDSSSRVLTNCAVGIHNCQLKSVLMFQVFYPTVHVNKFYEKIYVSSLITFKWSIILLLKISSIGWRSLYSVTDTHTHTHTEREKQINSSLTRFSIPPHKFSKMMGGVFCKYHPTPTFRVIVGKNQVGGQKRGWTFADFRPCPLPIWVGGGKKTLFNCIKDWETTVCIILLIVENIIFLPV